MEEKPNLFISGAIEKDKDYYYKFLRAEDKLTKILPQFEIVNPARFINVLKNGRRETYLAMCISALHDCAAIYMLKDFEDSEGACAELMEALRFGKTIIYEKCETCIVDRAKCKGCRRLESYTKKV